MNAAAPSLAASAIPVSEPVPRPHWPRKASPTRPPVPGVLGQPLLDVVDAEPGGRDVEALLGLGLGGLHRREEPLAQHPELQVVEQRVHLVAVPLLALEFVDNDVEVDGADEFGELPVADDAGQVLAQRVADLAGNRVDAFDQRVERAVLADPLRGGLLAHAGDAGQVVAGIAAQRRVVRVLLRREVVLVLDLARGEPGHLTDPPYRVEHGDVVGDELQRVAVAGADEHLHPGRGGLGGERGDDVVGLVALDHHGGDAQGVEHLADERDLAAEVVGRVLPAGLVLGVDVAAERLAGDVERDGQVSGHLVAQHVDEHRREPEHGVGGLPRGGREVLDGQRVEGPVGHRMPVDQQELRGLGLQGRHGP